MSYLKTLGLIILVLTTVVIYLGILIFILMFIGDAFRDVYTGVTSLTGLVIATIVVILWYSVPIAFIAWMMEGVNE